MALPADEADAGIVVAKYKYGVGVLYNGHCGTAAYIFAQCLKEFELSYFGGVVGEFAVEFGVSLLQ